MNLKRLSKTRKHLIKIDYMPAQWTTNLYVITTGTYIVDKARKIS
jgi:hypothetical protein